MPHMESRLQSSNPNLQSFGPSVQVATMSVFLRLTVEDDLDCFYRQLTAAAAVTDLPTLAFTVLARLQAHCRKRIAVKKVTAIQHCVRRLATHLKTQHVTEAVVEHSRWMELSGIVPPLYTDCVKALRAQCDLEDAVSQQVKAALASARDWSPCEVRAF